MHPVPNMTLRNTTPDERAVASYLVAATAAEITRRDATEIEQSADTKKAIANLAALRFKLRHT